uniref:Uncharacterized protein n=1 Tax=Anguilla anguilla TaxID=7936 RepID=A0A0E9T6Q6_ANGAN
MSGMRELRGLVIPSFFSPMERISVVPSYVRK